MSKDNPLKYPKPDVSIIISDFYQLLERDRAEDVAFTVNGQNIEKLIDELANHDPRIAEIKEIWRKHYYGKKP